MKKTVLCLLAAALLLGACGSPSSWGDSSQRQTPLAVVSLASYDQLVRNLQQIGKVIGRPRLADGLQGTLAVLTQGRGLAGLDTSRPWGAVIEAMGSEPAGYAFLPVDDMDEFTEVFRPYLRQMEDVGNGVFQVRGKQRGPTIYVKHTSRGWLLICNTAEGLADTPDDPAALLGDLPMRYNVALQLNMGHVSSEQREELIGKIRQRADRDHRRRPGENEREHTVRRIIGTQLLKAVVALADDVSQLTVGWSLDQGADQTKASLEVDLTASDYSRTAQVFNQWAQAKTRFSGFRLPQATVTGNLVATYRCEDDSPLRELLAAIRAKAYQDIDQREPSRQRAKAGKEIVAGLLDVIQETLAGGRVDESASLILNPDTATLVSARHISSGAKLQETFDQFVEAVRNEHPQYVDEVLRTDVGQLRGVRFHTLTLDVPADADNRKEVVRLIGERLELVVGIGKQSAYFAAGRDAMKTLQEAIVRSADAGETNNAAPVQLSLALGDVFRFQAKAGSETQRQQALRALNALGKVATGSDRVRLAVKPTERGVTLRLELEKGSLEIVEAMHRDK